MGGCLQDSLANKLHSKVKIFSFPVILIFVDRPGLKRYVGQDVTGFGGKKGSILRGAPKLFL